MRKLSGFNVPPKANDVAFNLAVEQVAATARQLIGALVTSAEPHDRAVEAARAELAEAPWCQADRPFDKLRASG